MANIGLFPEMHNYQKSFISVSSFCFAKSVVSRPPGHHADQLSQETQNMEICWHRPHKCCLTNYPVITWQNILCAYSIRQMLKSSSLLKLSIFQTFPFSCLTLLYLHPSNPSTTPCAAPRWPGWVGMVAVGRTGGSSHMTSPKLCRRCRAWATRQAWAWEPLACDHLDGAARVTCNARTSRSPAVCPYVCLPARNRRTVLPKCTRKLFSVNSHQ